jgi:hypothetical protein
MTPLRLRMTEDMTLAGLAPGTQAVYLDAVRRLATHYLHAELRAPTLDVSLLAGAVDDRGVPRTTKLYDRTGDEITLDEIERITS